MREKGQSPMTTGPMTYKIYTCIYTVCIYTCTFGTHAHVLVCWCLLFPRLGLFSLQQVSLKSSCQLLWTIKKWKHKQCTVHVYVNTSTVHVYIYTYILHTPFENPFWTWDDNFSPRSRSFFPPPWNAWNAESMSNSMCIYNVCICIHVHVHAWTTHHCRVDKLIEGCLDLFLCGSLHLCQWMYMYTYMYISTYMYIHVHTNHTEHTWHCTCTCVHAYIYIRTFTVHVNIYLLGWTWASPFLCHIYYIV